MAAGTDRYGAYIPPTDRIELLRPFFPDISLKLFDYGTVHSREEVEEEKKGIDDTLGEAATYRQSEVFGSKRRKG